MFGRLGVLMRERTFCSRQAGVPAQVPTGSRREPWQEAESGRAEIA